MNALLVFAARDLIFVLVVAGLLRFVCFPRDKRMVILNLGLLSAGVAFVLSRLAKLLYFNPRPFVIDGIAPLIPHVPDNGFPSDHALLGFTLAAIIYCVDHRAGIVLGTVSLFIGISRVFLRIHSPEDIIGSLVISIVAVVAAWCILRKYINAPSHETNKKK